MNRLTVTCPVRRAMTRPNSTLKIATAADGEPKNAIAHLNWQEACELGFCGDLREWERLLGVGPMRD